MFESPISSSIWQNLSADQQRLIINLLAHMAVKVVLPVLTNQSQEASHGLRR